MLERKQRKHYTEGVSMSDMENLEKGLGAMSQLIQLAQGTPEAKIAAKNIGSTCVTLTAAINNCLLPLAAVNFAFDKAKKYFNEKFQTEFSEKLENIPPEDIIEPKASIAGPVLQGIAFSHEEENLKELYLNLLSGSMNRKTSQNVHPAFADFIRQLCADEAPLLRLVLSHGRPLAIIELNFLTPDGGRRGLWKKHIMNFLDLNTNSRAIIPDLQAWVDNWVRLGLVEVDYRKSLVQEGAYDWIQSSVEYKEMEEECERKNRQIDINRGIISPTALGSQFALATGCSKDQS